LWANGLFGFSDMKKAKYFALKPFIPYEFYTKIALTTFPFGGLLLFGRLLSLFCSFFQHILYSVDASNQMAPHKRHSSVLELRLNPLMLSMHIHAGRIEVRNLAKHRKWFHLPKLSLTRGNRFQKLSKALHSAVFYALNNF
jgi:hypothetical protein